MLVSTHTLSSKTCLWGCKMKCIMQLYLWNYTKVQRIPISSETQTLMMSELFVCGSEEAFGFQRPERSSFLLLCNLIGKIQAALYTLRPTLSKTHNHDTNMLNLCFLSLYAPTQTAYRHMLSSSANTVLCAHNRGRVFTGSIY